MSTMTDDEATEELRGIRRDYYYYDGIRDRECQNLLPGIPRLSHHGRWLDPTSVEGKDPLTIHLNGSFTPQQLLAIAHFTLKQLDGG